MLETYQQQYEDISCQYALAADRIKPLPSKSDMASKFSKGLDVVLASMKKDFSQCMTLQMWMSFLLNNPAWSAADDLLKEKNLYDPPTSTTLTIQEASFSMQQLLLKCSLDILHYFLTTGGQSLDSSAMVGFSGSAGISKSDCLMLFKNICTYGAKGITETSAIVLFGICGGTEWWCDALLEIFQYCFGQNGTVPLPHSR